MKPSPDLWTAYLALMADARQACLALADGLERWLRAGATAYRGFEAACRLADQYLVAVRAAEPYHFGTIPCFNSGTIVNADADDALRMMRELRGTAIPVSRSAGGRTIATYRLADDGIAGFFALEVRSMRSFKSPRRAPAVAA